MTARISLIAAVITVAMMSCDTDRNIAPVFKTYFTKYYGEDGNQFAVDLVIGSDGSLAMLGRSESQTNPVTRSFVVKTDNEGVVLWQHSGGDNELPVDIEVDSRNHFLVLSNLATERRSFRITRIDQSGNSLDSVDISSAGIDLYATSITEFSDGQLMITGYSSPNLVDDGDGFSPPPDEQDLFVYRIDPAFEEAKLVRAQGGEHVGKFVKIFESRLPGPKTYYTFGDSDRPFIEGQAVYRQTFEVLPWDEFFVPRKGIQTGLSSEVQVSGAAIEMPIATQAGYLHVGSTGQETFRRIFVAQYTDGRPDLTVRFTTILNLPRSAEGVSAAYGEQDAMFVLGNEKQDNNNRDIYLAKLESDGAFGGEMRFGSVEGDDIAAAVRVLPDQRVAVFGTIELETQKKMMLTLISPRGTFSE